MLGVAGLLAGIVIGSQVVVVWGKRSVLVVTVVGADAVVVTVGGAGVLVGMVVCAGSGVCWERAGSGWCAVGMSRVLALRDRLVVVMVVGAAGGGGVGGDGGRC